MDDFSFCWFDLWSISSTLFILLTRSDFWLIPFVCLSVYLYVSVYVCLSIHCGQDPTCTTWGFIDGITGAEAPKGASDGSSGGEPSLTFSSRAKGCDVLKNEKKPEATICFQWLIIRPCGILILVAALIRWEQKSGKAAIAAASLWPSFCNFCMSCRWLSLMPHSLDQGRTYLGAFHPKMEKVHRWLGPRFTVGIVMIRGFFWTCWLSAASELPRGNVGLELEALRFFMGWMGDLSPLLLLMIVCVCWYHDVARSA